MNVERDIPPVTTQQGQGFRKQNGPVLVLGLGNILLKDEGIGVHTVGRLQECQLPDNVEVIDGGTASVDVLLMQEKGYKLVVIDAMKAGKEPGTIYITRLKTDQIEKLPGVFNEERRSQMSLHQTGLIDALLVAKKTDCAPDEITIIGVEPDEIDEGLEPTAKVKERIPEIINLVLEEIQYAVH